MEFRIPVANDYDTQEEFHNFKLKIRTEFERLFPINRFLGWSSASKQLRIGDGIEDPEWDSTKYIFSTSELEDLHNHLNQYELSLFILVPVRGESQFERCLWWE